MALQSLHIKNLAVIEIANIDFDTGLTVITGETGAGKSVILKALSLMLGARADNALIRHGTESCDVHAEFDIDKLPNAKKWLEDNDFSDEGNCTIRRVIKLDKGSKTYINGHPANLNQLKNIGQQLIDLHGQHEHQQLLSKTQQLAITDALVQQQNSQHNQHLQQLDRLHSEIKSLQAKLDQAKDSQQDISAKIDLLSFQVQELEMLEVKDEEFSEISQEYSRLNHAQELLDGFQQIEFDLSGNDQANVETLLGRSLEKIQGLTDYASELKNTEELLNSALANIQEAQQDVRNAAHSTELDPERLSLIEQRINDLSALARKHRCHENELGSLFENLSQELNTLKKETDSPDEIIDKIQSITKQYQDIAQKVSDNRSLVIQNLNQHVTQEMQSLGMEGGCFEAKLTRLSTNDMTAKGLDKIEFLSTANPGMPLQPLNKVASGGELSRISLAIQILAGSYRSAPTLIFDEVDVGVGGSTAEIVGNNLQALSQNGQVICITHLPQVAAKGDNHIHVHKEANIDTTETSIQLLNPDQRIEEIARMLGGIHITKNTLNHAIEILGLQENYQ